MCKAIVDLFSHVIKPKPPANGFPQYSLPGQMVANLVMPVTSDHVYIWDNEYWALDFGDWVSVIADARQTFPDYLQDRFDCEDFAFMMMMEVTKKYGVNTMGVAVGTGLGGAHGFNVFIAKEADGFHYHILEPQNGKIDPTDYKMDTVIFG